MDREQRERLLTAHIGVLQPWGKQGDRLDLWLRRKQRRVIASDVQEDEGEVQVVRKKGCPDPEPELLRFADGVSKFLRLTRSIEYRYLHLHVGEAWIRYRETLKAARLEYTVLRRWLLHYPIRELFRVIRES